MRCGAAGFEAVVIAALVAVGCLSIGSAADGVVTLEQEEAAGRETAVPPEQPFAPPSMGAELEQEDVTEEQETIFPSLMPNEPAPPEPRPIEGSPESLPPESINGETGREFAESPAEIEASIERAERPPLQRFFEDLFLFGVGPAGEAGERDNLILTLALSGGYDDNVFATHTDRIASLTATGSGTLRYRIASPRFNLGGSLSAGATAYQNRPGDATDYNAELAFSGMYLFRPRLNVSFETRTAYLSQPDPVLVGSPTGYNGDYYYTNTRLSLNYTLRPTVELQLGYRLSGFLYTEEAVNQNIGYYDQEFRLTGSWAFLPRTALLLEYRYNPITYYEANLGSQGHILLVGFDQTFSPRWKWTMRFGGEARILDNPVQGGPRSYVGPFVEGTTEYGFGPRSSLVAGMRFGTEPSGVSGVTIRQTLRGNIGLRHAFSGRLTMDVGISYENDFYDQPGTTADFTQEVYTGYISARYQINRGFATFARYNYVGVASEIVVSEYTRNIFSFGIEVIF
jgi:hypothetical protein